MENNETKVIDIFPIGKGKRILLWLCDLVITFFLGYVLMNLAVTPLSNLATNFNAVSVDGTNAIQERDKFLYKAELIYFSNPGEEVHDINEGFTYTYKLFMSDYVSNIGVYPHDIFKRYYTEMDRSENYYDLFSIYDEGLNYFIVDKENELIELKREYRDMFYPLIDASDTMSDEAKDKYNNFYKRFFLTFYSHMGDSLEKHDLVIDGVSYVSIINRIKKMNTHYDNMIIVDCFISYICSFAIVDILIPILLKKRQTISMLMMKIYRVRILDFRIVSKKRTALNIFYNFIMFMVPIALLAFPLVNFNYIFSLAPIMYASIISLVLCLFSLVTLLISGTNQTTSDMLSGSIIVDNETLDDIYRSKGYKI